MTRLGFCVALSLCLTGTAHAEPGKDAVDAIFAPWASSTSPGCAVGVTRDGRSVFQAGYGMADLEQGVANRPDTVFNIASLSKHFTTTAVELLAQQEKLSWDDDIRKYVPEIPEYGRPITLRHLANHTSGIRDFLTLLEFSGWNWLDAVTEERILGLIARQKQLNFPTGTAYTYSNSGYVLLGIVVKRVSGQPLGEFLGRNVFEPMGMLHTRVYDDRQMIMKNRAPGHYMRDDGKGFAIWRPTYDQIQGDGAVLTSVQDMAIWSNNFLHPSLGPNPQGLVDALRTPGTFNDGKPAKANDEGSAVYALGLTVGNYRGLPVVSHSGGIPGYATNMLLFPEQKLAVTVLCNLGGAPATNLSRAVADLYLPKDLLKGTPTERPKPRYRQPGDQAAKSPPYALERPYSLRDYAGRYASDELDADHILSAAGNGLDLRVGFLPATHFVPQGKDIFFGDGVTLTFARDRSRKVTGYTLKAGRAQGLVLVRTRQ